MADEPSELIRNLLLAAERLRRLLDDCYVTSHLNVARVDVMEIIKASHPEGCSQTRLSECLGTAESSVSMIVERMRRDGLLLRMRSQSDRRCSVLLLTDGGLNRLDQAQKARDASIRDRLSQWSHADLMQLSVLLEQLLLALTPEMSAGSLPESKDPQSEWGQAA